MAMVVGRCYMPSPRRSSQPMVRPAHAGRVGEMRVLLLCSCAESGRRLGAAVGLEKPACFPLKES